MYLSSNVEVSNIVSGQFHDENNYNDFKCTVTLDFVPTFNDTFKCEIALTHITLVRIDTPRLLKKNQDVLRKANIALLRVCLLNSGLDNLTESCVCSVPTDFYAGKDVENLVYHKINLKHDNLFHVQLRDEKDELISLPIEPDTISNYNYSVICLFHVRTMSFFDTKSLTLKSNNLLDKVQYESNY